MPSAPGCPLAWTRTSPGAAQKTAPAAFVSAFVPHSARQRKYLPCPPRSRPPERQESADRRCTTLQNRPQTPHRRPVYCPAVPSRCGCNQEAGNASLPAWTIWPAQASPVSREKRARTNFFPYSLTHLKSPGRCRRCAASACCTWDSPCAPARPPPCFWCFGGSPEIGRAD